MNTPALETPATPPVAHVMGLALGYLVSRSLHVVTELGVADLLDRGPMTAAELASHTGARPEALHRLLRTLAAHGVFRSEPGERFALNPAASLLQRGVMRDGVLLCGEVSGDGSWWNAAGALRYSVMTGEAAFEHQHGMGFFDYLLRRPDCAAWFDRGLANFAAAENPAVASAYDFSAVRRVVDVGGGQGGLLAEILDRHPGVHGTLFDLPGVVAEPAELRRIEGAQRWTSVGGDFFEGVPSGGDIYVLKRIAHDWSDEQCVQILRKCRGAMQDTAKLLVIDAVIPPGDEPHPGKVMDILMMVFAGGRERTQQEFDQLLVRAGLRLRRVVPTASPLGIVEAVPA